MAGAGPERQTGLASSACAAADPENPADRFRRVFSCLTPAPEEMGKKSPFPSFVHKF